MKAMILAAGYGTRLKPLTLLRPKPLFPILNKPLLSIIIEQLRQIGITEIAINTHHLSEQIEEFIRSSSRHVIHVLKEELILGTGGGLRNAERFLDGAPFLVINGDILTNIDLKAVYDFHMISGNAVTMVLHDYPKYNNVLIGRGDRITGFSRRKDGHMAFTGIHVVNPEVLKLVPEGGFYDILDAYRALIAMDSSVGAYVVDGRYWTDIGTEKAYLTLHGDLLQGKAEVSGVPVPGKMFIIGENASVGEGVQLEDWVCIGNNVDIGDGAYIARSVVWDGARIDARMKVVDAVIARSPFTVHRSPCEINAH
ncbi:MAG: NDP-sugar synthase [Pseudomonadota bacterium]